MRNSPAMEEALRSMVCRNPRNTLILLSISNDQDPATASKSQTFTLCEVTDNWRVCMHVHLMFTDARIKQFSTRLNLAYSLYAWCHLVLFDVSNYESHHIYGSPTVLWELIHLLHFTTPQIVPLLLKSCDIMLTYKLNYISEKWTCTNTFLMFCWQMRYIIFRVHKYILGLLHTHVRLRYDWYW